MGISKNSPDMKVLYIAHSENLQGAGIALINIVKGMIASGVECVVTVPFHGPIEERLTNVGARCHVVRCYNTIYPPLRGWKDYLFWPYRYLRTLLFNTIAKKKIETLVMREQPDVIHTNTGVLRFGAAVAKKYSIPHIWHIREFQNKDFFWVPIGGEIKLRRLYHETNNHCVAITKAVFNYFNLNTPKDRVIYDGVFSKGISIQSAQKEKFFLFVGALLKGKGILDLLDAFNRVSDRIPDHELWIAGRDYVDIKGLIVQSPHPDRIQYLGFRDDVYTLMNKAVAVVVPSYYEGFGFITVEAMLNGTIVIGRDTAGTKEQFDNGLEYCGEEVGIRFTTQRELEEALVSVANNPDDYQSMILQARRLVFEKYTIEENVNELLDYYKSVTHAK